MFKLNMTAIRKSANDTWLMANAANAANESGENRARISQQPLKLAKLAVSHELDCNFQTGKVANDPAAAPLPDKPAKPVKQTFMEWQDTWRELDQASQLHHINCPTCIAAGKGYGLRCETGFVLWKAYSDASCE